MKNHAFTLIELLIVVLIIGILAAVALPQYQKAVDKARMAQLITFAGSVKQTQQAYYLANGTYADKWDDIDIGLSGYTAVDTLLWKGDSKSPYARLNYNNVGLYLYGGTEYLPGILLIVTNGAGERICYADATSDRAQALCKTVCAKKTLGTDGSWKTCVF